MDHGVVVAAGDVEGIDALPLQHLSHGDGIHDGEAVRLVIGAGKADGDREIRPHLLADIPDNLHIDAHPVFQAPAVEIGAVVGVGGEEVGQQVAVGSVNLHQLKTGLLGPQGGIAEGVDNVLNLLDGEDMGHRLDPVLVPQLGPGEGGGGADGLGAQELLAAAVLNLDGGNRAHFPDVLRQPGQAGDVLVAGDAQMAVGGFGADVVHIGVLHHDAAGAAGGLVPVVPHQTLGDGAVHIAHAGGLGGLEDTVLQGQGANFAGGKQMGEHLGHR